MKKPIAFQGNLGAYGHQATLQLCPGLPVLPCPTFADAVAAAQTGKAQGVVLPVENSTIGRIADIHHLLPNTTLHIVAERYLPIAHALLGLPGATLKDIREVHSQLPALHQCSATLAKLKLHPVPAADTAGAAAMVAEKGDATLAAIASPLAAKLYGLKILRENMQDANHNTTRFILLAPKAKLPKPNQPAKTSLLFRTRSLPAALYKALGGFATNGINLLKIESYLVGGKFQSARFYIEAEGHTNTTAFQHALDELKFYASEVRILGCYPIHKA
jgi:prephenate dehydratase